MAGKVRVAILGSGNIGTDLMYKVKRNPYLEVGMVAGIDPNSDGLALARREGYCTSTDSVHAITGQPDSCEIVFDATTASAHLKHAPLLKEAGKIVINLTPAPVGEPIVPSVNLNRSVKQSNISLITCGGQATIPIVAAISKVARVTYAEIVATISSRSAGPGTRANIDEFTTATREGLMTVGGAEKGKALIILNPAEPPIMMTNTIYALVDGQVDAAEVTASIEEMIRKIQGYVPGYRLKVPVLVDRNRVITVIEVQGAGDYLPKYAGNLDIMTSAAVAVAEAIARDRLAI